MGTLYIVSTPIGNMEDITLRAKRILGDVSIIACEDTRKTGLLLKKLNIPKRKLLSFYEENESFRIPQILNFLKENKNVALVSNAGTPTISDPGYKLVRECLKQNISVMSIPGPSSILAALVVSGLPTARFLFLGFLPRKKGKRTKLLNTLPADTTIIFFESPFRLIKILNELKEIYGDIWVVICKELTKFHEETIRERITKVLDYFGKNKPQGELTILFQINTPQG